MGGRKHHVGCRPIDMSPEPITRRDAPSVAGNKAGKTILRHWGTEIIADRLLMEQEIVSHDRTYRVASVILGAGGAATISVPPCHGVRSAFFKDATKHVSVCHRRQYA